MTRGHGLPHASLVADYSLQNTIWLPGFWPSSKFLLIKGGTFPDLRE